MRQRIKKSTLNVEFCYSTVVARVNNSSSDEIRAELTRLNIRAAYRETTIVKTAVAVEFMMFGSPVQKPLDWIERLEAAHMEYKIIYKWLYGEYSKSWSGYH